MKSDNHTENLSELRQFASFPLVKGPVLGASMMLAATPFLNWTNFVLKDMEIDWKRSMVGATEYALSAFPTYAAAFSVKKLLQKSSPSFWYDFSTSFVGGALSGLVGTPFEAIAQTKQALKNTTSLEVRRRMMAVNGYSAFFQGALSSMIREGLWATVYLSAIPALSSYFRDKGFTKNPADGLALVLTAGAYGLGSCPLYMLRFKKQEKLAESPLRLSYWQHTKAVWNQEASAGNLRRMGFFFKAVFPRTLTTTFAAGVIYKSNELYESLARKL